MNPSLNPEHESGLIWPQTAEVFAQLSIFNKRI